MVNLTGKIIIVLTDCNWLFFRYLIDGEILTDIASSKQCMLAVKLKDTEREKLTDR